jgi:Tfp pilus assembly protein FimV
MCRVAFRASRPAIGHRRAAGIAVAPAEPSAQDRAVAAKSAAMAANAQAELQQQDNPEQSADGEAVAKADEATTKCAVCGAAHSAAVHLDQAYGDGARPFVDTHA